MTRKRSQFTLRSLLLVFVASQLILGLTAFLKHVGFLLACSIVAAGIGWWLGKWRLTAAAATGLLVILTTYLAFWIGMGYQTYMHYPKYGHYNLIRLERMLSDFREDRGEFPGSLSELADQENFHFEFNERGEVLDPSGTPYHYRKTADDFELATLGRDKAVGGIGLDADVYVPRPGSPPESRLPLMQYLFETRTSDVVFLTAAAAGLLAGIACFLAHVERSSSRHSLILSILAITVSTVVVAFFLAAFHVAASQSGH